MLVGIWISHIYPILPIPQSTLWLFRSHQFTRLALPTPVKSIYDSSYSQFRCHILAGFVYACMHFCPKLVFYSLTKTAEEP